MNRLILNIFTIFIIHNLMTGPIIVSAEWKQRLINKVLKRQDLFSEFSVEFSKIVIEENSKNFICSPISVAMPLAMITFGAANQTRKELISALHVQSYKKKLFFNNIREIMTILNDHKDTELYFTNQIFISDKFPINPQYKEVIETYFQSKCESINFEKSIEAAQTINNWCAQNTNNKIVKLVNSADFDTETSLVVVNAIYFKGLWKKPFNTEETILRPFFVDSKIVKEVPIMHQRNTFCYGTIPYLDAEFVNIPYKASSVSKQINMHIILPLNPNNLEETEKNLYKLRIIDFYSYCEAIKVDLYLPTFEIENKIDLQDYLMKLGINQMFKNTANFTNISKYPLKVTKIIQKAFINVNEKGSEAGAVTALQMSNKQYTMEPRKILFNVNRPFIAIIATRTNILLTAKVVDPVILNY